VKRQEDKFPCKFRKELYGVTYSVKAVLDLRVQTITLEEINFRWKQCNQVNRWCPNPVQPVSSTVTQK